MPHFNEVDECAGVDAVLTNRVWTDLGFDPSTTLHDVRWGADVAESGVNGFVWVFQISGAVPPPISSAATPARSASASRPCTSRGAARRQGRSKPGEIVWSRVYVKDDSLHMDIGRGGVVRLSEEETERRWNATTPQWPIMHAVTYGVTRDQMMAKHKANHIQVAYAPDAAAANRALVRKASMARALGLRVNLCGDIEDTLDNHQSPDSASERPVPGTLRARPRLRDGVRARPRRRDAHRPGARLRRRGIPARRPRPDAPGSDARLPADWALQHPGDYLEAIERAVPAALAASGAAKESIAGIGVDFTSCTILPVDASGEPLCLRPEWAARPHAWVKLWKHHASQPQADRINAAAAGRKEKFLADYGGRTSSEWLCAKALQVLEEDPDVYAAAANFVEAGDWIVWRLTGVFLRNSCGAGYKGFWSGERGFPSREFFAALDPRFSDLPDKLSGAVTPPGREAGGLTPAMAQRLGLAPGTPVASAIIDAHSAVAGLDRRHARPHGDRPRHFDLPHAPVGPLRRRRGDRRRRPRRDRRGLLRLRSGPAGRGRPLRWFARLTGGGEVPGPERFEALEREAALSPPGANGLLALDWWNGNRSVLVDANLSGLIVGLTLATTAGDIYRSLIEATAFSTRRILEAFERERIEVDELVAVGGLARRSPLLLQVYADVTRRPIRLAATANACALGAAMLGAVAAGPERGGHRSLLEAARAMAHLEEIVVVPDPRAAAAYDDLYREWLALHDHFGRGGTVVMARLRRGR